MISPVGPEHASHGGSGGPPPGHTKESPVLSPPNEGEERFELKWPKLLLKWMVRPMKTKKVRELCTCCWRLCTDQNEAGKTVQHNN